MNKLLLGLGLLDLALHFPHLTALLFVGLFIYKNLTNQDKQDIMSIYSNGKTFAKYLTVKANELGLSLQQLRKQIVVDLEVPETNYEEAFEFDINHPAQPTLDTYLNNYLSSDELQQAKDNPGIVEQVARLIKETVAVPESTWIESDLELFLIQHDYDGSFRKLFKEYLPELSLDSTFTTKDFRQLQTKLKSIYRNPIGEIIDTELESDCLYILKYLTAYFTNNYQIL